MAEKMSEEMIKIWRGSLALGYKGKEADILAALVATLFGKGFITREELDNLQEMIKSKSNKS